MAEANPLLGTDEQFRLFVDTVEEYAIFMMAPDGTLATWNVGVGRVLGYEEAEFVGLHTSRIFTPEDVRQGIPDHEMRTAAASGKSENERWHVRKDGSRFWGLGVLTALRDPAGRLVGYAKILRDRTDLKELQETLRNRAEGLVAADHHKNVFLATLAHEIRNHLAGISNGQQALRLLTRGVAGAEQPLQVIERQAGQLRRLVEDLMDVARVNTGKLRLRPERVELAGVVRSAVEAARPAVDAGRHRLSVLLPAGPVRLEADPGRLQQVLVNLLTNAAKYTPDGGDIWVSGTVEDNEVVVRVRDTGIGISAEVLPRIFDVFTQAPEAGRHAQGGLGIGLSLVRNLVHLHGGTVQVRSEGPGQGSEFTVRLPQAGREGPKAEGSESA